MAPDNEDGEPRADGKAAVETAPAGPGTTTPDSIVIRLDRRKHTVDYRAGDTLLETARRGGLRPPSSCEAGNCATCMAHLDVGSVAMRANNVLTANELDEGWVLTCQSIPTSAEIVVDYDA
ncbi:MAG TPA: 2Fe-2S iron-sulfur cluster binding domain-containing protein [Acidimicrobiia bacterium]|jgi:ferredoxin